MTLLLAGAGALRVAAMFYQEISGDDATVALMAKHILTGEAFPVFFYRETFMGSVNGLHLVPALFLFGPSDLTVRLNAVAWSLLFPLGLYVLGRRVFDEATARVALALSAFPPFLLTYWSTVAEPHFETNVFGVVLLLLTLAALGAEDEPAYSRALACLGLTAGLACWTSFKTLEVLAPALLVLWLRDPRLPVRRAGAFLAGGLVLGSLPAWLFYLSRGNTAAGTLGSVGRLFALGTDLSAGRLRDMLAEVLPRLLGSYYWEPTSTPRRIALAVHLTIYGAAVVVGLLEALRRSRARPVPVRVWGLWLLVLTLGSPFAMLYASDLETRFTHESTRYVLPVYIPLLLFAAALVVRVARRAWLAGGVLLAFLLLFDLWTHAAFLWPLHPDDRARRAAVIAQRRALVRHLEADRPAALYVDEMYQSLAWAFRLSGIRVSEVSNEIYVPDAAAADARPGAAILETQPRRFVTEALGMLGATYRATPFGRWRLLEDVRIPGRAYRPVPLEGWRVVEGTLRPAVAVADGDLGTAWAPPKGARALTVDLGAVYAVGRIVWWPVGETSDVPELLVAGSEDGVAWRPLGKLPVFGRPAFVAEGRPFFRPRDGWLELRIARRPLRYVRITTADPADERPWELGELRVYEDLGVGLETPLDGDALVALLRARGVTRLLADPALSARVERAGGGTIQVLTANGTLDSHGRGFPPARLADVVALRAADGLLVPREDAAELQRRLAVAGLTFASEPVGEHVLVHGFAPVIPESPCRRTRWRVSGGVRTEDARRFRYVVEAQLQEPQRVVGLRLEHPAVSVRETTLTRVALSDDGRHWRPAPELRRLVEWAWAGRTLFRFSGGAEELLVAPTPARYVRVELTLPYLGDGAVTSLCVRGEPR